MRTHVLSRPAPAAVPPTPIRRRPRRVRRRGASSSLLSLAAAVLGAAALLGAAPLAAQVTGTVTGRVIAAESGEPIADATVSVAGTPFGALTRNDGTYRIVLRPGRYELRARLIGFSAAHDTVVVAAGQTATRDFRLARAATNLDAVAVVGTRAQERTVTSSPVPVDVLTAEDIKATGRTETAQIIQALAPSFNFPRPSIADGTDHVRPATLRGLGPDQVLVLVNGKRRHTSALVNVNGTIGRGSAGVDLNAIPASMIERIEVLRDGAAAQYGSDAIAGVINIVLKSTTPGQLTSEIGRTSEGDGDVTQVGLNYPLTFGQGSFFTIGGEYRDRGFTNRARVDPRPQYFAGDPRNGDPKRVTLRLGDAATDDGIGMFNGAYGLANGIQLYTFGELGKRDGKAAANWRLPNGNNTVRAIHPDGFLPFINTDIWDASGAVGAKGTARGWRWDLSTEYGRNSLDYTVTNSNNATMGTASPTSFDAGGLAFGQWTSNLDFFREFQAGTRPVRVAVGGEYRDDQYKITAGDSASWKNGGQLVLDGPNAGAKPSPGAQGFPGFRPTDEQDVSRNNYAVYLDVESNVLNNLLLGVAGRYEDYSDFGSTTNGKVTARYELLPQVAIRGAASTGFRAPSLGQSYFSSTATNLIAGQFLDILTLPPTSAGARALGAVPLRPEKSQNYSAGLALAPLHSLTATVDFYQIDVKDRIIFSENFTGTAVQTALANIGITGVNGARFFTNAIDTRTRGMEVVANYGFDFARRGLMRLTGGYSRTYTRVRHADSPPPVLAGLDEVLFGRAERGRITVGQPANNFMAMASYDLRRLGLTARTQRYGEVTNIQPRVSGRQPPDQTFGAKWITDLSLSYRVVQQLSITLGSDNVFNVYPDKQSDSGELPSYAGNANFGMNPYNGISPFGFNGRFVYARATLGLGALAR
ncbi:MAG: TonB-dependent receptor [Gemmatimonadaceae bacterium]